MNQIIRFFTFNFNLKFISLLAAVIVWAFIHQTINESKPLIGVPIRVINLPSNKTIDGLLPNGYLTRRATLNIVGTKKVVDAIEPGDLEVFLDASNQPNDWLVHITKKNIHSLNPHFDFQQSIQSVNAQEFVIKLSRLVHSEIPIKIEDPHGKLPKEYEYIGIWPRTLTQTVSGPEEAVEKLKVEGLEININLHNISSAELADLKVPTTGKFGQDVISFKVPEQWKKVYIPFDTPPWQPINDPSAGEMWIEVLKKHMISLKQKIPIRVFYPLATSEKINPEITQLKENGLVEKENGINYLNLNLYAFEVSELFVDIVKNNMEIAIIADPKAQTLQWSLEFMEPLELEKRYLSYLNNQYRENSPSHRSANGELEQMWMNRFRSYMQNLTLYKPKEVKLALKISVEEGEIIVEEDAG